MSGLIAKELKKHIPFTAFGALTGIVLMAIFYNLSYSVAYKAFYFLHPLHVVLSAMVTAAMYKNYKCANDKKKRNIVTLLIVGFVGSIGIATLSDSILPYLGERLLNMEHAEPHVGFIEKWNIIFPLAGLGIAIAYIYPKTQFPHAGHVLISTWASLFHILMANTRPLSFFVSLGIFLFLFLAVWVPCCISDIVFPLLFVGNKETTKAKGTDL
ncbi:MAG: hypothetical protein ABH869_01010 [Candidatus Omnitrophota bacterium]